METSKKSSIVRAENKTYCAKPTIFRIGCAGGKVLITHGGSKNGQILIGTWVELKCMNHIIYVKDQNVRKLVSIIFGVIWDKFSSSTWSTSSRYDRGALLYIGLAKNETVSLILVQFERFKRE